ncbi:NYN domain-containing protein [Chloroflexota bacterium]
MNEEYTPERVMVFIDGNNLYHRLKENGWSTWTDIGFLAERLTGNNRTLVHTYYYNAPPPGGKSYTEKGNAYYSRIKKTPNLTFRYSWLQPTQKADEYGAYQSYREKGGDTAITTDLVYLAAKDEYDTAIIVASDGDYAPAAKTICEDGKCVEVVYFPSRKPFVMEEYALMRAFRPGYAVPYDRNESPPRKTRGKSKQNSRKRQWHRR